MNIHDYDREHYDRDYEIHKCKRLDSFSDEPVTTKDIIKITLIAVAVAPILYYGLIGMMALTYAVSNLR